MSEITCKNCSKVAQGNFCNHCGQSTKVDRINLSGFLKEFSGSVFHLNKGLFYSIKELSIRPGHSIREYLSGKRKNHFKPVAYAFTLSTIYFIISILTNSETFIGEALQGYSNGLTGSEKESDQLVILKWLVKNYAYAILLFLPFYSLASFLAFFKSGYNYLEHIVLNAYIIGQQAIIYSLFALLSILTGHSDLLTNVTLLISVSYTFFVFIQFFSDQRRIRVGLFTILTYGLSLLILIVVISLVLVISHVLWGI